MINSSSYRTYHLHVKTQSAHAAKNTGPAPAILQLLQNQFSQYLLHVPVWLFLYFIPQLLLLAINTQPSLAFADPLNAVHLLSFTLVITFSYINYYWLLPLFMPRKKLLYGLSAAAFIAAIIGLQYLAEAALAGTGEPAAQYSLLPRINYHLILLMVSVFAAIILRLQEALAAGRNEIEQIKLSLLNTQINPHFLFNSLNWIYLLAIEKSAQAPRAIVQLSGLMRYVLKESGSSSIDLKKELEYIRGYIALQKGRLGDTVTIHSAVPSYTGKGKIAPLLAMSFIENAFKHGINPDEDSAIHIDIAVTDKRFFLQVVNNKVSPAENSSGTGLGISNARERLAALYPSMHHLEILEDNRIYSVKLSIDIV